MPKGSKRVHFAPLNQTHLIERRGTARQPIVNSHVPSVPGPSSRSRSALDDEVKDHPVFASPIPITATDTSAVAVALRRQLENQPQCTSIHNPLTNRSLTRFGANYWKLLEHVFGRSSEIFARERDEYTRLHKKPQA